MPASPIIASSCRDSIADGCLCAARVTGSTVDFLAARNRLLMVRCFQQVVARLARPKSTQRREFRPLTLLASTLYRIAAWPHVILTN